MALWNLQRKLSLHIYPLLKMVLIHMGKFSCVIVELEGLTVSLCDKARYWLAHHCRLLLLLKHLLWLLELWNHVASNSDVVFVVLGWKLIWNKILVVLFLFNLSPDCSHCFLLSLTALNLFLGFICWSWRFIYISSFGTIFWVFVVRLPAQILYSWTHYRSSPVSLAFA